MCPKPPFSNSKDAASATGSRRLARKVGMVLVATYVLVALWLMIGEDQERKQWEAAPSTLSLYENNDVCTDEVTGNILNCGQCGACSNVHDIQIYHKTSKTLTGTMTECAFQDLLFGRDVTQCLQQEAGLTLPCTKCWVQNYRCNRNHCIHTCVKARFFSYLPFLNDWNSEPLTPCIACDERLCGPEFMACAGANRRQTGVVSDLERDLEREFCTKVDWDWLLSQEENEENTSLSETPDL